MGAEQAAHALVFSPGMWESLSWDGIGGGVGEGGYRFGDKSLPLVSDRPGIESQFCHFTGCSKSLPLSEPQFL